VRPGRIANDGRTGHSDPDEEQALMDPLERYGRIALALAVALLFLTVFASMVTGRLLTLGLIVTFVAAMLGAGGMIAARLRGA
jgi:hypothetical protein